jgi:23S rRNA pseudouridine1911/1915/1917 synthase
MLASAGFDGTLWAMSEGHTVKESGGLLSFLFAQWPEQKRTRLKQCLKYGSVRVNGVAATRHDHPLQPGDVVSIRVEGDARKAAPPLPVGIRLLHEDAAVVVIAKGPGWLSVARDSGKGKTVYEELTRHVRHQDARNRVWIVHRLDRETSGLMVFAKTEEAKRTLQSGWHDFGKTYQAVVEGTVAPEEGTLRGFLDESNPMRVRLVPDGGNGREAVTRFRVVRRGMGRTWLEVGLETGRRHQIRVQLAGLGHPVVGDARYGAATDPARRLGLHASGLGFVHPGSGEAMNFSLPMPPELAKLAG